MIILLWKQIFRSNMNICYTEKITFLAHVDKPRGAHSKCIDKPRDAYSKYIYN